jgi:hypothetical protein
VKLHSFKKSELRSLEFCVAGNEHYGLTNKRDWLVGPYIRHGAGTAGLIGLGGFFVLADCMQINSVV